MEKLHSPELNLQVFLEAAKSQVQYSFTLYPLYSAAQRGATSIFTAAFPGKGQCHFGVPCFQRKQFPGNLQWSEEERLFLWGLHCTGDSVSAAWTQVANKTSLHLLKPSFKLGPPVCVQAQLSIAWSNSHHCGTQNPFTSLDTKVLSLANTYYLTAAFLFAKDILKRVPFLKTDFYWVTSIWNPAVDKASVCSLLKSFQAHCKWPSEGFSRLSVYLMCSDSEFQIRLN